MIGGYATHGYSNDSLTLFHLHDAKIVSWNVMIGGYIIHGYNKDM